MANELKIQLEWKCLELISDSQIYYTTGASDFENSFSVLNDRSTQQHAHLETYMRHVHELNYKATTYDG